MSSLLKTAIIKKDSQIIFLIKLLENNTLLTNYFQYLFFPLINFKLLMSTRVFTFGAFSPNESNIVDDDSVANKDNLPDFSAPKQFIIPAVITQIACGQSHIISLSTEGSIFTFGTNQFGQRGSQLTILPKMRQIAAGIYHTLALSEDDMLYSWGRGIEGQLGSGNFDCLDEPQMVLTQVEKIFCGGCHTLAMKKDQKVYSCGDNSHGQLGIEQSNNFNKFTPINLSDIIDISAGLEHTLFLTASKDVYSCGNNLFGQCGIENQQSTNKPMKINLNQKIKSIFASSGTFSAAINESNQIYVWGTGSWGYARKPSLLNDICPLPSQQIKDIKMGDSYAILLFEEGQPVILGSNNLPNNDGQIKNVLEALSVPSEDNIICGQKLVITLKLESEVIQPEVKKQKIACPAPKSRPTSIHIENRNEQQYLQIARQAQNSVMAQPAPCNCKELETKSSLLQKSLKWQQEENDKLQKELEQTKSQIKLKNEIISSLTTRIQQFETENLERKAQQFDFKTDETFILPSDPFEQMVQTKEQKTLMEPKIKDNFFKEKRSESLQNEDIFRAIVQQKRTQQFQPPEKASHLEESFNLSRYNLKTIRSITPIDMRSSDLLQTSFLDQTIQQQPKQQESQLNESVSKCKREFDKNNIQYYTKGQQQQQTQQQAIQYNQPSKIEKPSLEYKNYINTSIIDKISSFQRTVGNIKHFNFSESAASMNRKPHTRVGSSGAEFYQLRNSNDIKSDQLQYRFSVCEVDKNQKSYKPYEDYYRLRG